MLGMEIRVCLFLGRMEYFVGMAKLRQFNYEDCSSKSQGESHACMLVSLIHLTLKLMHSLIRQ